MEGRGIQKTSEALPLQKWEEAGTVSAKGAHNVLR